MTDQEQSWGVGQDTVMTRIGQVMMLLHGGDREEARTRFGRLWEEIGEDGDPLHRCTLAHFMADTQDDPEDELEWDLRALRAADGLSDERTGRHHESLAVRGFYPSLHLNLAADYLKVGERELARNHLVRARSAAGALGDDDYGDGLRAAIGRMELRLDGSGHRP
ncbi:hypothetical protein G3I60_42480 [Streptomyces sp. SID13666]|uniref:hypothetical protein n=2 Tax=Streptomyces TaxID=1883 RepID=UPI001105AE3A|nr:MULTISPECIES: hypothetical protein [Streptomyces]MCZ4103162.1 hypothetical protein [Streptomyces sp. H39-C1]NEA60659.1 hypothetical protein [Streptomyces sp. SID13666]NEA77201.1 hypothetical protein [Streptomyces sp. SID13588]QNA71795.1 hypothetical protein C8250_007645 [Streptomyces sp. So13.3]